MAQGSLDTLLDPTGSAIQWKASLYGRQNVGQDTILFYDPLHLLGGSAARPHGFRFGAVPSAQVPQIVTTGYGIGAVSFNSAQGTGGITQLLETLQCFTPDPGRGLYMRVKFMMSTNPNANHIAEVGFGNPTGGSVSPYEGVFLRWGTDSALRAVSIYAGAAEVTSAAITNPSLNVEHLLELYLYREKSLFFIDGVLVATINTATGNVGLFRDDVRSPWFARHYIAVSDSTGPALALWDLEIRALDTYASKLWHHVIAGNQDHSAILHNTQAQSANYTNSVAPTAAILSNTAAGYTTLGGKFVVNMVAGAETDYALFAYQMPVGKQLYITGVEISSAVSVALGTSGALLEWAIAVNSSAVSLATADSAGFNGTLRAPRKIGIGSQGFAASAAANTVANQLSVRFDTPIVCQPSANNIGAATRFFHVILRIPVGGATGTIRGCATLNGYWD